MTSALGGGGRYPKKQTKKGCVVVLVKWGEGGEEKIKKMQMSFKLGPQVVSLAPKHKLLQMP